MRAFLLQKCGKLKEAAVAMEMTPAALSQYLHDRIQPGTGILLRLRKLGCDINWLLTGEEAVTASEQKSKSAAEKEIVFKSKEEEAAVRNRVQVYLEAIYSFLEFADDDKVEQWRKMFTDAELERQRRRAGRRRGAGILTKGDGTRNLQYKGVRKLTKARVDEIIADAVRDAGPPSGKDFKPTWDSREKCEAALSDFLMAHRYVIDEEDKERLIDALVILDTRGFSTEMTPERLFKEVP
jgi:transcriptional regulator with XRE-family HTH domain